MILHPLVVAFSPAPMLHSNLVQLGILLLADALCIRRFFQVKAPYFRGLWLRLGIAFLLWTTAQGYVLWRILLDGRQPSTPSFADFLWLLYSFSILLVTAKNPESTRTDWSSVLDIAQGCISVLLLYAVVYTSKEGHLFSLVYNIQSVTLLFACSIRYSSANSTREHLFFRDLMIYVFGSGIFAAISMFGRDYGMKIGGITDLAWSYPALLFCAAAMRFPESIFGVKSRHSRRAILPAHIHGISSMGLALTCMAMGLVITLHAPKLGIAALICSVTIFSIRTAIRESQLKKAQLQLEYDSLHDSLTGLANRNLLSRKLSLQSRKLSPIRSLLFLDIDRFKVINDSLGHAFGDRLLVHVAKVLRSAVTAHDTVARLGGDEFVILLAEQGNGPAADFVAERILHFLRSPVLLEGRILHITGSIGIVTVLSELTANELLRNADAAMYIAKSQGKNRAHLFDHTILEKTTQELELESSLRHTMEEGRVIVGFQPIYSLKGKKIEGFEALARWHHPQRGFIAPGQFIPLAEDTGLILELGRQIFQKACHQVSAWNERYDTRFSVSVNVSPRQLEDKDFLSYIESILKDTELPSSLLKIEITESVLLSDRQTAEEILGAARNMGIEICLDDFGTGYSSLSYLLEFPFDVIKIDKSFVQDLEHDSRRAEVIKTIIRLAKNLGKKITAEGVETHSQLEFLNSVGCDSVQGFFFAQALSAQQVEAILDAETRSIFEGVSDIK